MVRAKDNQIIRHFQVNGNRFEMTNKRGLYTDEYVQFTNKVIYTDFLTMPTNLYSKTQLSLLSKTASGPLEAFLRVKDGFVGVYRVHEEEESYLPADHSK